LRTKDLVLPSLALDSDVKLWMLRILGGDIAVAISVSKSSKFGQALLPKCGLGVVPHKAQLVKSLHAGVCHGRVLAFELEFILISLSLSPLSQSSLYKEVRFCVLVRYFASCNLGVLHSSQPPSADFEITYVLGPVSWYTAVLILFSKL
jgi:hypothetical protein